MRQLANLRAIALAVTGAFVVLPAIGQHAGHEAAPASNVPAPQDGQAGSARPATPGAVQQDHNAAAAPASAHDHPPQPVAAMAHRCRRIVRIADGRITDVATNGAAA